MKDRPRPGDPVPENKTAPATRRDITPMSQAARPGALRRWLSRGNDHRMADQRVEPTLVVVKKQSS
jgi:hypothetical protein